MSVDPLPNIPYWGITNAKWISVGASCNQASTIAVFRIICTDIENNIVSISPPITFTTTAEPADFGTVWAACCNEWIKYSVCANRAYIIIDTTQTTGQWTFNISTYIPSDGIPS
jgi:hypothetical protein